ncbi:alpha-ketoglutarate permease [Campylobacter jejuni subsp. jejuni 414]|nr:alpha-ketoglutarate permease [Campylobacter jejuni subsp. jejuni 414]
MLGKAAIIKEPKAIKTTDITIDFLRPTLSAKDPRAYRTHEKSCSKNSKGIDLLDNRII